MDIYFSAHAFKHGLTEEQIRFAWDNFVRKQHRNVPQEDEIIAVGYDREGSFIEIVAINGAAGVLVYHATVPPTSKFLKEIGLLRR